MILYRFFSKDMLTKIMWFFFQLIQFKQRLITLQYCSVFCRIFTWISHGCICSLILNPLPPPSLPHPSGLSQSTSFECPASFIELTLVIYFTYGIYRFQRYSLKSSHLCLFPHTPKACYLHLCLFCFLAYKIIVTIFLSSKYMS